MERVPLVGYSDKLSVRPGEKIEFKVSSKSDFDYTAELYRSINADPNPSTGGLLKKNVTIFLSQLKSFQENRISIPDPMQKQ